jgi:hypothetical protein
VRGLRDLAGPEDADVEGGAGQDDRSFSDVSLMMR